MRELREASAGRRTVLFVEILDAIAPAINRPPPAGIGFRTDPPACLSAAMNLMLQHTGNDFTRELSEAGMASRANRASPRCPGPSASTRQ